MTPGAPLAGVRILGIVDNAASAAVLDVLEELGAVVHRAAPGALPPLAPGIADAIVTDTPGAFAGDRGMDIAIPVIAFAAAPDPGAPYRALSVGSGHDLPGYGRLVEGQLLALAILATLGAAPSAAASSPAITLDPDGVMLAGLWTFPLDWSANGVEPAPLGNRDADAAPHGVYRCRDGRWLAIACTTETHWEGFRAALGRPDWCDLERMRRKWSRLREQKEIDRHIQAWLDDRTTAGPGLDPVEDDPERVIVRKTADEVAAWFQSFGVPCAVVVQPSH